MSSIEKKAADLPTLASRINEEHRRCEEAVGAALRHAINAGELLAQAKEGVPHGSWGAWLKENFAGSERTAQAYMKVFRGRNEIRNGAADLSLRGALKELSAPAEEPVAEGANEAADGEELAELIRGAMERFGPNLWEEEKPLVERRLAAPGPQEEELLKKLNVEWLHQLANQVAVDGFLLEVRDEKPVLTYRTPDKSRICVEPVPTPNAEVRGNIERGSEVDAVCNFMVWRHLENWLTAVVGTESTDANVILRRVEHNADWRRGEPADEFLRQQWSKHRKRPEEFASERGLGQREFRENLGAVRAWVSVEALRWARMLMGETRGEGTA